MISVEWNTDTAESAVMEENIGGNSFYMEQQGSGHFIAFRLTEAKNIVAKMANMIVELENELERRNNHG